MSARRVAAVIRRIVAQFRRDRRTLALLFVAPILIMALLGWVVREQNAPAARIAFVNQDGAAGAAVVSVFERTATSAGLVVEPGASTEDEARAALRDGNADIAVVVPSGFARAAASGGQPKLVVITPGLNPTAEAGNVGAVQQALIAGLREQAAQAGRAIPIPDVSRETVYGSPNADTLDALAPVFVGYFGYFFVFILTGISFLRERVGGTLERLLATPVTRAEIVLGYSLGFGIFATLQVALVLAFTLMRLEVPAIGPIPSFVIGLDVPNAGNPLLAFALALVLGLGAVSLGIFISTFARTEFQVLQFIPVVIIPQGLLGGVFWPIDALPSILQPIARLLPITYAVEGLRDVMIAGQGLASPTVRLDLAVLLAIAALFVVLAAATIRREVA